ncbi:MAG TPA: glycerol-3-phosphate dehydrogenase/oxidase [Pyrinomonadaceae bacterium]|nr:glycerol-3-phosphate dehydrogenase/oxidase [Pyrinomonadaceae bacterium]
MSLHTFNKRSRPSIFRKLSDEKFDLLVIGGGITGASIFRDAALRGMKVALVEAKDFASATSGRSSKLIHGGLRYIKNLGIGLAWESCHERNLHIRLNKRLVRPLPFLVPLYRDQGEPRWLMRLGMIAYEALSGFNNHRFHRFLSREETLLMAPALPAEGLTGGCLYYDAVINDSRWTMEVLKDGVAHGGIAVNYSKVTQLLHEGKQAAGARVYDELSGSHYDIRSRVVVNATGIFADKIKRLDGNNIPEVRRFSKGTHLVFNEEDVPLSTTIVFSSPLDGRSLFLAKHEECFLYGTSDHWEEARPDLPIPSRTDVDYLLKSLNQFMPEAQLDQSKVQFVYSGFRPLISNRSTDSSSITREDYIDVSPSGLVSVIGGKLTTARITAVRVLDRVFKLVGRNPAWSDCKTHKVSIGGTNEAVAESLAYWVRRCPKLTSYFRILYQRYGLDADEICAAVTRIHEGSDPTAEPIRAEVQYVCRHEMVCTLEDLIDRRAGFLYWNAAKRLERLRYGVHIIRTELDLSESEFESQFNAYREHLRRFHSLPKEP